MDKEVKLEKALQEAKKAFWDEIDGDTDLPSGFGVEVIGLVKTYDTDVGDTKLATNSTHSYGHELEKYLEENFEEETEDEEE